MLYLIRHLMIGLVLVCLFSSWRVMAEAVAEGLYQQRIVCAVEKLTPVAQELAETLEQITGKDFAVVAGSDGGMGIHLVVAAADDASSPLRQHGIEAFQLASDGGDRLLILGNSERAVRNGVYAYLELLGMRWYGPTEVWTITPSREKIALKLQQISEPMLAMRGFSGTGGFGGSLKKDSQRQLEARWGKFAERLRLDGAVAISGHYGEAFNMKYRETIEAHPEMRAEINGVRQPFDEIVKPCTTNPMYRQLYVKDRVEGYSNLQKWYPGAAHAFAVSVEPADGGGHCECAKCKALGSVSNQIFSVVNETAKAVREAYPQGQVSLLAYNEHAMPPDFALEPNVFVIVTPYAFQRTGLSPEKLLRQWADRTTLMGVYDYWSIPDWSDDMPDFNLEEAWKKVRLWRELHVMGTLFESTYSIGSIGPAMYLYSRYSWDPEIDPHKVLDEFYSTAFGQAAPPMKRMIERWMSGFMLGEHELGLSYRDLLEADALADSAAVRARIDDYKRYVHYIRLWFEYQQATGEERTQAADKLITYCWRIYETCMIHAYRMAQLISLRYERNSPELAVKWEPYQDNVDWASLTPVDTTELNELIMDGVSRYHPLNFTAIRHQEDWTPVIDKATESAEWIDSPSFGGHSEFVFYARPGISEVELKFTFGIHDSRAPFSGITISDPQGNIVLEKNLPTNNSTNTITIATNMPGSYRISVFDQKSGYRVQVPVNLPFAVVNGMTSTDLSRHLYFWVPKGQQVVAIYAPGVIPVEVQDSSGTLLPSKGQGIFVVEVPEGQDGKVWSISKFKSWDVIRMLNTPDALSFSAQGVLTASPLPSAKP